MKYTYLCDHFAVDGGWSRWACGSCRCGGTQECTRSCNSPTPECGRSGCYGSSVERKSCGCCPGKTITSNTKS